MNFWSYIIFNFIYFIRYRTFDSYLDYFRRDFFSSFFHHIINLSNSWKKLSLYIFFKLVLFLICFLIFFNRVSLNRQWVKEKTKNFVCNLCRVCIILLSQIPNICIVLVLKLGHFCLFFFITIASLYLSATQPKGMDLPISNF